MLLTSLVNTNKIFASQTTSYTVQNMNNTIVVEGKDYGKDYRINIQKDNKSYTYKFNSPKEILPTQFGEGEYLIQILKLKERKIEDGKSKSTYSIIKKMKLNIEIISTVDNKFENKNKDNLNIDKNTIIYLTSTQPIYWEHKDAVIEKAQELAINSKTASEKIQNIYEYIINNIKYDTEKIKGLEISYIPDIDEVLKEQKGICYDYAALLAGMLRSQGIPTKLVTGYNKDILEFHAWNEIYVNDTWEIIDTTYDASFKNSKNKPNMYKLHEDYKKSEEF